MYFCECLVNCCSVSLWVLITELIDLYHCQCIVRSCNGLCRQVTVLHCERYCGCLCGIRNEIPFVHLFKWWLRFYCLLLFAECVSWRSACHTSWECGSNYEYQVFQALPPTACPAPPPYFIAPPEPGVCQISGSGMCEFQGERM